MKNIGLNDFLCMCMSIICLAMNDNFEKKYLCYFSHKFVYYI